MTNTVPDFLLGRFQLLGISYGLVCLPPSLKWNVSQLCWVAMVWVGVTRVLEDANFLILAT